MESMVGPEMLQLYIAPVLAGILLSAAAGFRIFLPLAVLSWAANLDYLDLHASLSWLESRNAAGVLTAAVVVELMADKFPAVDNLLDSVNTVFKPIAGALVMAAPLVSVDPVYAVVIGIAAGSTVAGGIHIVKAKTRLAANFLSFGFAAPVLSFLEDAAAFLIVAAAIFFPVAGIVAVAFLLVFLLRLRRPEPA